MSYILKALKKLDEEKAALRTRPHDINSALLAADRKPQRSPHYRSILAIVVLIVIVGGGSVYFFLPPAPRPSDGRKAPAAESTIRDQQGTQPQASPPLPSGPAAEPEKKPAAGHPDAGLNQALPVPGRSPEADRPHSSRESMLPPAKPSQRGNREPSGPAPSGLKVSGIALQDDPSESVAVINGILVRRGMTILDSKVEEIFQDRVRFSGNGQTYEVFITR